MHQLSYLDKEILYQLKFRYLYSLHQTIDCHRLNDEIVGNYTRNNDSGEFSVPLSYPHFSLSLLISLHSYATSISASHFPRLISLFLLYHSHFFLTLPISLSQSDSLCVCLFLPVCLSVFLPLSLIFHVRRFRARKRSFLVSAVLIVRCAVGIKGTRRRAISL